MIPLSDTKTSGKFPFWVFIILAINIWVFYLELTSVNTDLFIAQYALVPELVDFSQVATLIPFVTSQFLHGGFVHIISNMWFLWIFADNVEEKFGFLLFPVFYLLAGAIGGLAQYITVVDSNIPMLGASGAIAGVLGAYLALFPYHKIKTLVPIFGFFTILELPASFVLILWFFTQLFAGSASILSNTASMGGIAFLVHAGGFTFGWIVGKLAK